MNPTLCRGSTLYLFKNIIWSDEFIIIPLMKYANVAIRLIKIPVTFIKMA